MVGLLQMLGLLINQAMDKFMAYIKRQKLSQNAGLGATLDKNVDNRFYEIAKKSKAIDFSMRFESANFCPSTFPLR
jgi:hypothetical protein